MFLFEIRERRVEKTTWRIFTHLSKTLKGTDQGLRHDQYQSFMEMCRIFTTANINLKINQFLKTHPNLNLST